jgi:hypothetical protein
VDANGTVTVVVRPASNEGPEPGKGNIVQFKNTKSEEKKD